MHLGKFFNAIGADWLARMSGPLTVPFTIAAIWLPGYSRIIFACLAISAAAITCYRVWATEHIRSEQLQACLDRDKPLLTVVWSAVPTATANWWMMIRNTGKRHAHNVQVQPFVRGQFAATFDIIELVMTNGQEPLFSVVTRNQEFHNIFSRGSQWFKQMLMDGFGGGGKLMDEIEIPLCVEYDDESGERRTDTTVMIVKRPGLEVATRHVFRSLSAS